MKVIDVSNSKKVFISLPGMDFKGVKKRYHQKKHVYGINKYYAESAESFRTHCAIFTSSSG